MDGIKLNRLIDHTLLKPEASAADIVLYPLHDIAPALVVPGHGPVADLLAGCRGQAIERLAERAG